MTFIQQIKNYEEQADQKYYDFLKDPSDKNINAFFDYLLYLKEKPYVFFMVEIDSNPEDPQAENITIDFYIQNINQKLWISTYSFIDQNKKIQDRTKIMDPLYGL